VPEVCRLALRYKGERDYLHGTDIFDALNELAGVQLAAYVSRIAFRRQARHELRVVDTPPASNDEIVAEVVLSALRYEAEPRKWWLLESDVPVTQRYAYTEEPITRTCELDAQRRRLCKGRDPAYSLIEELVAAHKHLCNGLVPGEPVRWLFAQLSLCAPLPADAVRVELVNTTLLGGRMAASDIWIDGDKLGNIRFMGA